MDGLCVFSGPRRSPGPRLRTHAETQEGQAGLREHRIGEDEGALDQDGGHEIAQHVPRHDAPGRHPEGTGREIAMIFQEPMTSLNPLYTVGDQIIEVIRCTSPSRRRGAPTGRAYAGSGRDPGRRAASLDDIRIRCRAACASG